MKRFPCASLVILGSLLIGCQTIQSSGTVYPVYPEEAAAQCIGGFVEFRYKLDERRAIKDFEILFTDPPGVFDDATRENVEMYQYKEIYRGGWKEAYIEYYVEDDCVPSIHNPSLNTDAGKAGAG